MNPAQLERYVRQRLQNIVSSDPRLGNVQLLVSSNKLNIHWLMAAGNSEERKADADQPFHTASIGKTFTAVIIAKLYEQGSIKFDDPIAKYLSQDLIEGLHVHKGRDYTNDIQVQHLMKHTSGLSDFFVDKPKHGQKFLQIVLDDPDRFWTSEETIDWSKTYLQPRFQPGQRVRYTDTGYNLLGLIIESITSKPYHEVLHEYIFNPLQMKHSYLSQYSAPQERSQYPTSRIHVGKQQVDVDHHRSFSSFYAGGQTVSTTTDLHTFMKALVQHELIREETLNMMQQWRPMWPGIDYGSGLMRTRFLPFTKRYVGWGHLGVSGSSMLYFPSIDTYIIGSFNHTSYRSRSMRFNFNVLRKLSRLRNE